MSIELIDLETFIAVAESGSVNRAAAILRLSQPAVTRRLQRLEATLGAALLDRRARPPVLTPVGKQVLDQSRQVLNAIEELHAIASPQGEPKGEFRLGVANSLAELVLVETADHLRQVFPQLTLRLTTAWSHPLLEQVRVGALDTAIVYLPEGAQPPSPTVNEQIATVPLVFVAPRERRMARITDPADIIDERWVLNPDGCVFRAAVQSMLDRFSVPLRVAVEAYGVELQLALVARGAGLSLVPQPVFHRSRVRTQVRAFHIREYEYRLGVWMVSDRLPVALTCVVTSLHDQLGRMLRLS